ncbi:hypothetical protein BIY24_09310 [Halobacteriovorax marinus]|uniref:Signal-transduction sensor protein n=1 Tax=Halobacteriovorax marinus (strain ATCC BAA-682 / DSM 15412 / SJ) TaxID=862908 RepID=E1X2N3_HALMS|nr:signal-transduction sensor protein [Halobacteriovorax marinus]ATH08138.1 hypothetical protein BIY24_09310 [Halobacteriovorax marinus]CBW26801.1 putative signal-transduction sensor protein [Halobacteriovorax marinus SJ]
MSNIEASLLINEIFFSKTDLNGNIQFGNEVFTRICEFNLEDMQSRPHNIVRHPSMPKEVFKILWSYLESHKPVCSYVKNKTKNNKYYWVFALVIPLEDGHLSIRVKPTSSSLKKISELYDKCSKVEQEVGGISGTLIKSIKALGYSSYSDFMIQSIVDELKSRSEIIINNKDPNYEQHREFLRHINKFCSLKEISKDINSLVEGLSKDFSTIKYVSISLLAMLEHYGAEASPLRVIVESFSTWSKDIQKILQSFIGINKKFNASLDKVRFKISTYSLQNEMSDYFKEESNNKEYIDLLNMLSQSGQLESRESLRDMKAITRKFNNIFEKLQNSSLVMKVIKMNSRIEYGKLGQSDSNIESGIGNIDDFVNSISLKFKELDKYFSHIDKMLN